MDTFKGISLGLTYKDLLSNNDDLSNKERDIMGLQPTKMEILQWIMRDLTAKHVFKKVFFTSKRSSQVGFGSIWQVQT